MQILWKIALGVFGVLLTAGLILLVSAGPRGNPIELTPPPSPAPLIVHVTGAVRHPGVYRLPAQSRVQDAVQSAGGFLPAADPQALNLAAFVVDGEQIVVPGITTAPARNLETLIEGTPESTPTTTSLPSTPTPRALFPIDINTASSIELELLPEIGPVRAARIVAYRQAHGRFERIEDIQKVYDINPEVYAAIRDLITASGETAPSPTPSASTVP